MSSVTTEWSDDRGRGDGERNQSRIGEREKRAEGPSEIGLQKHFTGQAEGAFNIGLLTFLWLLSKVTHNIE
jgi:hypothetical protein